MAKPLETVIDEAAQAAGEVPCNVTYTQEMVKCNTSGIADDAVQCMAIAKKNYHACVKQAVQDQQELKAKNDVFSHTSQRHYPRKR